MSVGLERLKRYRQPIINIGPPRGDPVEPAIVSVSVVAATSAEADALGTCLIGMGRNAGLHGTTQRQISADFLSRDGDDCRSVMTPAFVAAFETR